MTTTWNDEIRQAIEAACKAIRETSIAGGRKVWDLLTDERSRRAVIVVEKYAAGEATDEELSAAARDAADAAWEVSNVSPDAATWEAAAAAAHVARAAAWAESDLAASWAAWAAAHVARAAQDAK